MLKPVEWKETEKNILVWKAPRVEIIALQKAMCVYSTSLLCVETETFPQLTNNISDLILSTT